MTRPRFLADHDLNEHIVDGVLRHEPTIEFIRAREVGLADRTDAEVLEYAASHGLLVVSHDVNTMPAQAHVRRESGQPMAGLLMVPQSRPIRPIIEDLILSWAASDLEDWRDRVQFLPL